MFTRHSSSAAARRPRSRVRVLEALEPRTLLSAAGLADLTVHPFVSPMVTNPSPVGYTPAQVRHAYQVDQVGFQNGSVVGDGKGQTIAIVNAYDDPNIASDLAAFDRAFGLPNPPSFKKVNQTGGTSYPSVDTGWAMETALDVEWAHAIAPQANILLVEAQSSSVSDLLSAIDYARKQPGVSVVSMSWGGGEFSQETTLDSHFTTPAGHQGVSFVAASGDDGAGASWPAVSPNVLSVGGTSLSLSNTQGSYGSELAWSGSGGGFSSYEREPQYQSGVQRSGARTTPDVAYNADPRTGVAVYDSLGYGSQSGWFSIGGTSAGTPQWAGLIAIANQGRALSGAGSLRNTPANVYQITASDYHDVRSGSNGSFAAGTGYDFVTGRGSPVANLVIRDLAGTAVTAPRTGAAVTTNAGQTTATTTRRAVPHAIEADLAIAADDAIIAQAMLASAETTGPGLPSMQAPIAQVSAIPAVQASTGTALVSSLPSEDGASVLHGGDVLSGHLVGLMGSGSSAPTITIADPGSAPQDPAEPSAMRVPQTSPADSPHAAPSQPSRDDASPAVPAAEIPASPEAEAIEAATQTPVLVQAAVDTCMADEDFADALGQPADAFAGLEEHASQTVNPTAASLVLAALLLHRRRAVDQEGDHSRARAGAAGGFALRRPRGT